ncbi:MAG: MarR family transcriptional regulator [Syntrophales bacterium]|nr:MarR family transcriptional regulator [Syntrophales bacterium]MDD5531659.1 MarR family transcriptional regulator [Syntrophales bacterium]
MPSQYEDCILFLLGKAYQRALGCFKRRLQEYGLTPVQSLVIVSISEEEGLSAGEIAKKLILDYATLSGVLDRLAEGGWIIKETAEDDKRLLRIYLTSKAREMTKDIIRERDGLNEEVLGGLKLEEKLLLKRLLRDLQK